MNHGKLSLLSAVVAGILAPRTSQAVTTTIPVTGWNVDIIAGVGEPTTANGSINATMDGGTVLGGFVYYQQGVNGGSPATGLPAAGTLITSNTGSGASFSLQSYTASNALLLDGGTKTLTIGSPSRMSQIALYGATGAGSGTDTVVVHYVDTTIQTFTSLSGSIGQDWFNGGNNAFTVSGRLNPSDGSFDQVGSGNPRIYEALLNLTNTTSPVTSVDITFTGSGHNVIYAISGNVIVPEPSGAALLALGALALTGRKRRSV